MCQAMEEKSITTEIEKDIAQFKERYLKSLGIYPSKSNTHKRRISSRPERQSSCNAESLSHSDTTHLSSVPYPSALSLDEVKNVSERDRHARRFSTSRSEIHEGFVDFVHSQNTDRGRELPDDGRMARKRHSISSTLSSSLLSSSPVPSSSLSSSPSSNLFSPQSSSVLSSSTSSSLKNRQATKHLPPISKVDREKIKEDYIRSLGLSQRTSKSQQVFPNLRARLTDFEKPGDPHPPIQLPQFVTSYAKPTVEDRDDRPSNITPMDKKTSTSAANPGAEAKPFNSKKTEKEVYKDEVNAKKPLEEFYQGRTKSGERVTSKKPVGEVYQGGDITKSDEKVNSKNSEDVFYQGRDEIELPDREVSEEKTFVEKYGKERSRDIECNASIVISVRDSEDVTTKMNSQSSGLTSKCLFLSGTTTIEEKYTQRLQEGREKCFGGNEDVTNVTAASDINVGNDVTFHSHVNVQSYSHHSLLSSRSRQNSLSSSGSPRVSLSSDDRVTDNSVTDGSVTVTLPAPKRRPVLQRMQSFDQIYPCDRHGKSPIKTSDEKDILRPNTHHDSREQERKEPSGMPPRLHGKLLSAQSLDCNEAAYDILQDTATPSTNLFQLQGIGSLKSKVEKFTSRDNLLRAQSLDGNETVNETRQGTTTLPTNVFQLPGIEPLKSKVERFTSREESNNVKKAYSDREKCLISEASRKPHSSVWLVRDSKVTAKKPPKVPVTHRDKISSIVNRFETIKENSRSMPVRMRSIDKRDEEMTQLRKTNTVKKVSDSFSTRVLSSPSLSDENLPLTNRDTSEERSRLESVAHRENMEVTIISIDTPTKDNDISQNKQHFDLLSHFDVDKAGGESIDSVESDHEKGFEIEKACKQMCMGVVDNVCKDKNSETSVFSLCNRTFEAARSMGNDMSIQHGDQTCFYEEVLGPEDVPAVSGMGLFVKKQEDGDVWFEGVLSTGVGDEFDERKNGGAADMKGVCVNRHGFMVDEESEMDGGVVDGVVVGGSCVGGGVGGSDDDDVVVADGVDLYGDNVCDDSGVDVRDGRVVEMELDQWDRTVSGTCLTASKGALHGVDDDDDNGGGINDDVDDGSNACGADDVVLTYERESGFNDSVVGPTDDIDRSCSDATKRNDDIGDDGNDTDMIVAGAGSENDSVIIGNEENDILNDNDNTDDIDYTVDSKYHGFLVNKKVYHSDDGSGSMGEPMKKQVKFLDNATVIDEENSGEKTVDEGMLTDADIEAITKTIESGEIQAVASLPVTTSYIPSDDHGGNPTLLTAGKSDGSSLLEKRIILFSHSDDDAIERNNTNHPDLCTLTSRNTPLSVGNERHEKTSGIDDKELNDGDEETSIIDRVIAVEKNLNQSALKRTTELNSHVVNSSPDFDETSFNGSNQNIVFDRKGNGMNNEIDLFSPVGRDLEWSVSDRERNSINNERYFEFVGDRKGSNVNNERLESVGRDLESVSDRKGSNTICERDLESAGDRSERDLESAGDRSERDLESACDRSERDLESAGDRSERDLESASDRKGSNSNNESDSLESVGSESDVKHSISNLNADEPKHGKMFSPDCLESKHDYCDGFGNKSLSSTKGVMVVVAPRIVPVRNEESVEDTGDENLLVPGSVESDVSSSADLVHIGVELEGMPIDGGGDDNNHDDDNYDDEKEDDGDDIGITEDFTESHRKEKATSPCPRAISPILLDNNEIEAGGEIGIDTSLSSNCFTINEAVKFLDAIDKDTEIFENNNNNTFREIDPKEIQEARGIVTTICHGATTMDCNLDLESTETGDVTGTSETLTDDETETSEMHFVKKLKHVICSHFDRVPKRGKDTELGHPPLTCKEYENNADLPPSDKDRVRSGHFTVEITSDITGQGDRLLAPRISVVDSGDGLSFDSLIGLTTCSDSQASLINVSLDSLDADGTAQRSNPVVIGRCFFPEECCGGDLERQSEGEGGEFDGKIRTEDEIDQQILQIHFERSKRGDFSLENKFEPFGVCWGNDNSSVKPRCEDSEDKRIIVESVKDETSDSLEPAVSITCVPCSEACGNVLQDTSISLRAVLENNPKKVSIDKELDVSYDVSDCDIKCSYTHGISQAERTRFVKVDEKELSLDLGVSPDCANLKDDINRDVLESPKIDGSKNNVIETRNEGIIITNDDGDKDLNDRDISNIEQGTVGSYVEYVLRDSTLKTQDEKNQNAFEKETRYLNVCESTDSVWDEIKRREIKDRELIEDCKGNSLGEALSCVNTDNNITALNETKDEDGLEYDDIDVFYRQNVGCLDSPVPFEHKDSECGVEPSLEHPADPLCSFAFHHINRQEKSSLSEESRSSTIVLEPECVQSNTLAFEREHSQSGRSENYIEIVTPCAQQDAHIVSQEELIHSNIPQDRVACTDEEVENSYLFGEEHYTPNREVSFVCDEVEHNTDRREEIQLLHDSEPSDFDDLTILGKNPESLSPKLLTCPSIEIVTCDEDRNAISREHSVCPSEISESIESFHSGIESFHSGLCDSFDSFHSSEEVFFDESHNSSTKLTTKEFSSCASLDEHSFQTGNFLYNKESYEFIEQTAQNELKEDRQADVVGSDHDVIRNNSYCYGIHTQSVTSDSSPVTKHDPSSPSLGGFIDPESNADVSAVVHRCSDSVIKTNALSLEYETGKEISPESSKDANTESSKDANSKISKEDDVGQDKNVLSLATALKQISAKHKLPEIKVNLRIPNSSCLFKSRFNDVLLAKLEDNHVGIQELNTTANGNSCKQETSPIVTKSTESEVVNSPCSCTSHENISSDDSSMSLLWQGRPHQEGSNPGSFALDVRGKQTLETWRHMSGPSTFDRNGNVYSVDNGLLHSGHLEDVVNSNNTLNRDGKLFSFDSVKDISNKLNNERGDNERAPSLCGMDLNERREEDGVTVERTSMVEIVPRLTLLAENSLHDLFLSRSVRRERYIDDEGGRLDNHLYQEDIDIVPFDMSREDLSIDYLRGLRNLEKHEQYRYNDLRDFDTINGSKSVVKGNNPSLSVEETGETTPSSQRGEEEIKDNSNGFGYPKQPSGLSPCSMEQQRAFGGGSPTLVRKGKYGLKTFSMLVLEEKDIFMPDAVRNDSNQVEILADKNSRERDKCFHSNGKAQYSQAPNTEILKEGEEDESGTGGGEGSEEASRDGVVDNSPECEISEIHLIECRESDKSDEEEKRKREEGSVDVGLTPKRNVSKVHFTHCQISEKPEEDKEGGGGAVGNDYVDGSQPPEYEVSENVIGITENEKDAGELITSKKMLLDEGIDKENIPTEVGVPAPYEECASVQERVYKDGDRESQMEPSDKLEVSEKECTFPVVGVSHLIAEMYVGDVEDVNLDPQMDGEVLGCYDEGVGVVSMRGREMVWDNGSDAGDEIICGIGYTIYEEEKEKKKGKEEEEGDKINDSNGGNGIGILYFDDDFEKNENKDVETKYNVQEEIEENREDEKVEEQVIDDFGQSIGDFGQSIGDFGQSADEDCDDSVDDFVDENVKDDVMERGDEKDIVVFKDEKEEEDGMREKEEEQEEQEDEDKEDDDNKMMNINDDEFFLVHSNSMSSTMSMDSVDDPRMNPHHHGSVEELEEDKPLGPANWGASVLYKRAEEYVGNIDDDDDNGEKEEDVYDNIEDDRCCLGGRFVDGIDNDDDEEEEEDNDLWEEVVESIFDVEGTTSCLSQMVLYSIEEEGGDEETSDDDEFASVDDGVSGNENHDIDDESNDNEVDEDADEDVSNCKKVVTWSDDVSERHCIRFRLDDDSDSDYSPDSYSYVPRRVKNRNQVTARFEESGTSFPWNNDNIGNDDIDDDNKRRSLSMEQDSLDGFEDGEDRFVDARSDYYVSDPSEHGESKRRDATEADAVDCTISPTPLPQTPSPPPDPSALPLPSLSTLSPSSSPPTPWSPPHDAKPFNQSCDHSTSSPPTHHHDNNNHHNHQQQQQAEQHLHHPLTATFLDDTSNIQIKDREHISPPPLPYHSPQPSSSPTTNNILHAQPSSSPTTHNILHEEKTLDSGEKRESFTFLENDAAPKRVRLNLETVTETFDEEEDYLSSSDTETLSDSSSFEGRVENLISPISPISPHSPPKFKSFLFSETLTFDELGNDRIMGTKVENNGMINGTASGPASFEHSTSTAVNQLRIDPAQAEMTAEEKEIDVFLESPNSGLHRISSENVFQQNSVDTTKTEDPYKKLERSQSDASLLKKDMELMEENEVHLTAAENSSGQNISECNRVYLDLSKAEAFEKVELGESGAMMRTSSGRLLETIPQDEELKTGDLSYIYTSHRSFSTESSSSLEDLNSYGKSKSKDSGAKYKNAGKNISDGGNTNLASKSNLRSSFQIYSHSLKQKVRQLQMGSLPEQVNALKELNVLMEQAWSMPVYGKDLAYELCDILRTESALDIIVGNVASSNRELMKVSARLLEQSLTTYNRRQVSETGLETVVKMTHDAMGDCELAQTCTGILESLFKTSEDTCTRVIKLGGLDVITYWCRCNDRVTLKNCAIALSNLALYGGRENQQEMTKHKVPEWLFPLAFVEDDSVRYYALLAIGVLVSNKEIENSVIKSGTMALVLPFVDSHDPAEFAQRDTSHRHGRSPGWLKRLIPVLSSKREEAQSLAAFHFVMEAGIKSEQDRKEVLYKIEAVEPLKWLASTPNRVASRLAGQALRIIGEEIPHKLSQQVPLWTTDDVAHWIAQVGFSAYTDMFQAVQVDGDLLLRLSEDDLKESLDMPCSVTRKRFQRELTDLKMSTDYTSCDPSMLGSWLRNVGEDMAQYTYPMLHAGLDRPLLNSVTNQHLMLDCGVTNGIHRMKILAKIDELKSSPTSPSIVHLDKVDNSKPRRNPKTPIDVFISYRRSNGSQLASLLKVHLQLRGFTVFIDIERLRAGKFDENLLESVKNAKNFIIVLTQNSLDRCLGDDIKKDWVHREISAAMEAGINIIPLMDNFRWPPPDTLPEDMRNLVYFNGIRWIHDYQDACVDKLESFLRGESSCHREPTPVNDNFFNICSPSTSSSKDNTSNNSDTTVKDEPIVSSSAPLTSDAPFPSAGHRGSFQSASSPPYQRAQGLHKDPSVDIDSPPES